MPPFCVTTNPPSVARCAALAPPPTVATARSCRSRAATRYSAPSATLVKTSELSSPHHTGPSAKRIPVATTSASADIAALSRGDRNYERGETREVHP